MEHRKKSRSTLEFIEDKRKTPKTSPLSTIYRKADELQRKKDEQHAVEGLNNLKKIITYQMEPHVSELDMNAPPKGGKVKQTKSKKTVKTKSKK